MRFFKKPDHRQKLLLSNGSWQPFQNAGEWGVLATEDNYVINEFAAAQRQQRGGIEEISAEEFQMLKKKASSFNRWKDEVQEGFREFFRRTGNLPAGANPVEDKPKRDPQSRISRPAGISDFRPQGVRR